MQKSPTLTRKIYSVGEFSASLSRALLEQFPSVCIRGEVTNLSLPRSGHWYFALKDNDAQIRVVMFKGSNIRAPRIKEGDHIIACGKPSVYRDRGDLQLIASHIQADGAGDLLLELEQRRKKLGDLGYYLSERKKELPTLPRRLAIVTSESGAVIHDIKTICARRAPILPVLLFPASVQGPTAIKELCAAIAQADQHPDCDLIMLARGGGSLEDFAAFNSEPVADAIFNCQTPLICCVGHESDSSIADRVADAETATPSEAAERVTAGYMNLHHRLAALQAELHKATLRHLQTAGGALQIARSQLINPKQRLENIAQRLDSLDSGLQHRMVSLIQQKTQRLDRSRLALTLDRIDASVQLSSARVRELSEKIERCQRTQLIQRRHSLSAVAKVLNSVSPLAVIGRGYSLVEQENQLVSSVADLDPQRNIKARLKDGTFDAKILRVDLNETAK